VAKLGYMLGNQANETPCGSTVNNIYNHNLTLNAGSTNTVMNNTYM
jgi:hypothetical protein